MAEEFTEKLIEKVQECVLLYDTGHPEYKNLVKKAEALFARAEISKLDVQTTPASSPHYSAYSKDSGLTSNESNAPQESTELTYTNLSESTNLNNAFISQSVRSWMRVEMHTDLYNLNKVHINVSKSTYYFCIFFESLNNKVC
jgi:hypothetical protein